jgi:aldehyde:ferredoxin oxidoreductase
MQPILTVDLSKGEIDELLISDELVSKYLGGATLAARILYDHLTPGLEPLCPEAPLLFMNGPLSGTAGPAVGRFVVCGKSPATRLWAESHCGGFWGPELRKTGYDGILIMGRSESPVYLWISGSVNQGQKVEVRSAERYWGLDTYRTQAVIEEELEQKNIRVASIGIAGESLIPFSLILCDHGRVAGRTGMGALMGSKNLKAIAVKGNGSVPIVEMESFKPLRSRSNRGLKSDPFVQVISDFGTSAAAEYFDYLGEMPKRYFSHSKFPEEIKISGTKLTETILTGKSACHACVIACGRKVRLAGEGEERKGPEYESLVGFGPNLWLNNLEVATKLNELCDRYGMDTISLSNTIGLAFRLFEMGVIDQEHTGGLTLNWGDDELVEKLVHLTATRAGFGAEIADGARELARRYAVEDEAVQVNGLEVAFHDPRGSSGMAIVYATSPRGACHNQSDYYKVDIGQAETSLGLDYHDPKGGAEKALNVKVHQDWRTLFNSLVMCQFSNVEPELVVKLINSVCGLDWSIDDMMNCGERGWTLKRVINNRLGLTKDDDRLPEALRKPFEDVASERNGFVPDLEAMLDSYYSVRGWDPKTGVPSPNKLKSLELDWVKFIGDDS